MIGVRKRALGIDVVLAISQAKTDFRFKRLRLHNSEMFFAAGRGGTRFLEANIGRAQFRDPHGDAAKRRLVLKVQSEQITEMYFSDNQRGGAWVRILDF